MLRSISFRSTTSSSQSDKEMHEIIRPDSTTTADPMDTIQAPDLTVINDRTTERSDCPILYTMCSPSTHRPCRTVHRTLSHLKEKFIPHRAKRLINTEKNRDYVVVDKPGLDHICSPQELIYPHDLVSTQPMHGQYSSNSMMINHASCNVVDQIDMQSTRSGVQCDVHDPEPMESDHDSAVVAASSTSSSSSSSATTSSGSSGWSTNSSNPEFSGIDRSILDDTEYIRAQYIDLERINSRELNRSRKLQSLLQSYDLNEEEETEFLRSYEQAQTKNLQLHEELRRLKDEYELMRTSWTCTSCTYINEPYSVTHSNVCQMCEGPSPSKQMMLMQ